MENANQNLEAILISANKEGYNRGDICKCIKEYEDAKLNELVIAIKNNPLYNEYWQAQYLYIVDKEAKIKENDYVCVNSRKIVKVSFVQGSIGYFDEAKIAFLYFNFKTDFLVIATNNPDFTIRGMSNINEDFIDEFVKLQGKGVTSFKSNDKNSIENNMLTIKSLPNVKDIQNHPLTEKKLFPVEKKTINQEPDYIIVREITTTELVISVNEKLKQGYKLIGGVTFNSLTDRYLQAMYKIK